MKKKSILITSLALCLVAVVAVGATFALLSDSTGPVVNHFTVSENGIDIALREPAWDGLDFDDALPTDPDWVPADTTLGFYEAQNIVPNRVIDKDPTVKNTGDHDCWIALKVEYTKDGVAVDYSDIADQVIFTTNTSWEEKANSDRSVYYFKSTRTPGQVTDALFSTVTIADVDSVYPFDITLTAYAVQAEGVDYTTAQAKLDALMAA